MRWCLRRLLLASLGIVVLGSTGASAAMIGFSSENSGFRLFDDTLEFGTNIAIDLALDDGGANDGIAIGYSVVVSDLFLTGASSPLGGGLTSWEIDATPPVAYTLTILDGTGSAVLTADYDPGAFLSIGTSGMLSPELSVSLSNVTLTSDAPSLVDLAKGEVDLNIVLSAAGQDFGQRIAGGQAIVGTMAGTLHSVAAPEAGTLLLLGAGLTGLAHLGGKRR